MSIHFITGKPGGGKGLYAMKKIIDELVEGDRPIITNLPVKMEPWVDGTGKPQIGLLQYMRLKHPEIGNVAQRVHVLPDENMRLFFCYRLDKQGLLHKAELTENDTEFDTTQAAEFGGHLYVVDEAWKTMSSRDWQKTGKSSLYYASQHRKFGDDLLIVTQNSKQVETAMRQVAQDFTVCTNHGKMRMGWFRQPSLFTTATFMEPPTGAMGQSPNTQNVFKLDKAGIAGCYDTSGGVGIMGKTAADKNERKSGIPVWVLITCIIVALFLIVKTPFWLARGVAGATMAGIRDGAAKSTNSSAISTQSIHSVTHQVVTNPEPQQFAPLRERGPESQPQRFHPIKPLEEDSDATITGIVSNGKRVWIYLSNGEKYEPGDREVELITDKMAVINKKVYLWPKFAPTQQKERHFDPPATAKNISSIAPAPTVARQQRTLSGF